MTQPGQIAPVIGSGTGRVIVKASGSVTIPPITGSGTGTVKWKNGS